MGRVATVWGGLATAAIVKLTKEYGKFEQEMRRATSVLDITEETFATMSKTAEDAAIKWNMAATDTAKAYLFMGRAGLTATEQMQAFPHMILASKAMMEDLEDTTEGIINTMNAFQYEFSQTGEVVNIVTEAVNKSTQNLDEMLIALSYSSKPAQSMNNTLSELSAMLAMVANEGIRGSKAGTALRFALTALASPMTDTRRMIRDLGLQVYDTNGKTVPLINVIGQLQQKLKGATEESRNMVLETLFGRRAMPAMIALYQQSAETIAAFAKELEGAGEAAEDVAKRQMKSFLDQIGRMWQALVSLTRHIGQALAPTFIEWANILEKRFGIWREWIDSNQEAVKHVLELTLKVGLLSTAFGVAMVVLPSFVNALKSLYNIIAGIIGLLMNPRNLIFNPVMLLAGVYVLSVAWRNNFKGIRDFTIKIFEDIKTNWEYLLDGLLDAMATPFNAIIDTFFALFRSIKDVISTVLILLGKFGVGDASKQGKVLKDAWDVLNSNPFTGNQYIQEFVGPRFKQMIGWVQSDIAPAVGEAMSGMWDGAKELFGLTLQQFKEDVGGLANWFSGVVDDMFDKTFGRLLEPIKEPFSFLPFKTMEPMYYGKRQPTIEINRELPIVTEYKLAVEKILDEMKTMQQGVDEALQGIVDSWADSFEYLISHGSSLAEFFNRLFNDILSSFNRMVAEMAANQLFLAIFGKGASRSFVGSPLSLGTLFGDLTGEASPTPNVGGLLLPEYSPKSDLGGFSSPKIAFVMNNNTGTPVEAAQAGPARFNGEEYVVNVVMKKLGSSSNFRRSFQPEY
jgi:TP901 family phage tail tape measure protein